MIIREANVGGGIVELGDELYRPAPRISRILPTWHIEPRFSGVELVALL